MKHQGPTLKIINTCCNCEFLDINLNGVKCNKLEKWLSEDYNRHIRPHELCPFLKSEKEMLENKLAEIKATESKMTNSKETMEFSKQEKLKIKEVLKKFEIPDLVRDDDDEIQYDSNDELSLNFLNKIQEELSNVKITISGNYECGVSLFFKKVL